MENKKIGALWVKTTKSGQEFFSISIGEKGKETRYVAFQNEKTKETQPDFNIYESRPYKEEEPMVKLGNLEEEINPSDLPF